MRSPLQVTFMVTVVSASGKPSESRWQLFNDYYRTIYERELHKAVRPFDKVLNERRPDIDALHHRVAFILQARAESSGGTRSDMAVAEFEELVLQCLRENGLDGTELEEQKRHIVGAANQRLVFLTSRVPGRLSFDVRSLQEYMAAASITNADSPRIISRLKALSPPSYWRNTLLFAIGRFFVEPQMRDHRDLIRVLCEDLNKELSANAKAKLGSRIALDILESGVVGNVPLVTRSLSSTALELLSFPPDSEDSYLDRLARIYDTKLKEEYESSTSLWIGQSDSVRTLAAWTLLLKLDANKVGWASELITENFPVDPQHGFNIFLSFFSRRGKQVALTTLQTALLKKIIPQIEPQTCLRQIRKFSLRIDRSDSHWLGGVSRLASRSLHTGDTAAQVLQGGLALSVEASFTSCRDMAKAEVSLSDILSEKNVHPGWELFAVSQKFLQSPTLKSLAAAVRSTEKFSPDLSGLSTFIPWPLTCAISDVEKFGVNSVLTRINEATEENLSEWIGKEEEWTSKGIELSDLYCEQAALFGKTIQTASWSVSHLDNNHSHPESDSQKILAHIQSRHVVSQQRFDELWLFFFVATVHQCLQNFQAGLLTEQIEARKEAFYFHEVLLEEAPSDDAEWANFIDLFGRTAKFESINKFWRSVDYFLDWLASAYESDPKKLGIYRLLAIYAICGKQASSKQRFIAPSARELPTDLGLMSSLLSLIHASEPGVNSFQLVLSEIHAKIDRERIALVITFLRSHGNRLPSIDPLIDALTDNPRCLDWTDYAELEALRASILQSKESVIDIDAMKLPRLQSSDLNPSL